MAKLYVGTYFKYNNGSLGGEWVDLEDYNDASEFFDYIRELHDDEDDPEFMFQDYDDIPSKLYSESMSEEEVQEIYDFLEYDESERSIIEEYWNECDNSASASSILEAYYGEGNGEDVAEQLFEETGDLDKVPDTIRCHIDWEGVWRDMTYDGWCSTTNYVFSPIY